MRQLIDQAMRETRDILDKTFKGMAESNKLGEQEMLHRYTRLHEGNPRATALFVVQNAPKGANPLAEFQRYEQQMEGLRKKYGVQRGTRYLGRK